METFDISALKSCEALAGGFSELRICNFLPDTDPELTEKSDPDPQLPDKSDPDP